MSHLGYGLMALFLAAVLAWQLISGKALGTWWSGQIMRQDRPLAYWIAVALQGVILIAFLVTGRSWHLR